jgi:hypothetical protein
VNFLMPIKARNWLLPPPKETNKMRMTSPLTAKLDALESDILALEKQMAATLEKKTVRAIVAERIRDPARWADDPDGTNTDAATLAATPPGDDGEETDAAAKFDALTRMIASRDGVSLEVAAARARKEDPALFAAYQSSGNVAKSFSELIADEIRKGCSPLVARQKINYAYPALARASRESRAKSESGVAEFMACVSEINKRDGCSRTAAMMRARRENPAEFSRFQNV